MSTTQYQVSVLCGFADLFSRVSARNGELRWKGRTERRGDFVFDTEPGLFVIRLA